MINKKVFNEFLQEVKGVEKQKEKYEKVARIQRAERKPFAYWDEVVMLLAVGAFVFFIAMFMLAVKLTFS